MWREWRLLPDLLSSPLYLLKARSGRAEAASRARVMVLPGFGSPDTHTWPLRRFLALHGFRPEGWGLGRNRAGLDLPHTLDDLGPTWTPTAQLPYRGEASVPYLCDCVGRRLRERVEATGEPFSLVGWSLGGYVAREVARDNPDLVSQVITMGSPVVGGPKYTAAAAVFRRRGLNLDWIESEIAKRDERPIRVPITAIVSPSDAVVSEAAALDLVNPTVKHVRLDVAHLGMGFNRQVWQAVLEALG